jgi:hypothetical protein
LKSWMSGAVPNPLYNKELSAMFPPMAERRSVHRLLDRIEDAFT